MELAYHCQAQILEAEYGVDIMADIKTLSKTDLEARAVQKGDKMIITLPIAFTKQEWRLLCELKIKAEYVQK